VQEPTIADIRAAIGSKDLTCRQLVQMYLDRIEAYDKKGPSLNASQKYLKFQHQPMCVN